MNGSWDILCKELNVYGINVIDEHWCICKETGKKLSLSSEIYHLREQHNKNSKLIKQLLFETIKVIDGKQNENGVLDLNMTNLFMNSVPDLLNFVKLLSLTSNDYERFIGKYKIDKIIRGLLDKDCNDINSSCANSLINYKISLDWIYRKICKIEHIASILMFLHLGKKKVDKIIIKEARGVQGPWSNLDLPMEERVFSWDEVAGETYGREKDKRNQQRYKMGLDTYNKSGRVGEGYYWREMRNEPFSWNNRFIDSPYQQLRPGTWR